MELSTSAPAGPDSKLLFDASPHPYLVLLPDAAFTIVAVNDRYLDATGTRREAIVGHGLFEIFPDNPNDASGSGVSDLRASLNRVLSDRRQDIMGVQKYDIPLRDGSGRFEVRYWSPVNTPVFAADGSIAYLIHHVEDVTEFILGRERANRESAERLGKIEAHAERMEAEVLRRAAEVKEANRALKTAMEKLEQREAELLRLNERLQELDRIKTEFFSNVSHELRTPLTLILGPSAKWLESDTLSGTLRSDFEVIERNARQLYRHVTDILDVAKVDAKQMQLRYAQTNVATLARFVASHFEVLAAEQGYRFRVVAPKALLAQLDVRKAQRILFNLLSNAFKFTPPGGTITVTVSQEDDNTVSIRVQDDGPGVPEDFRTTIFEPFRQYDASASRQFGGTGLGLSIVRDFANLHGGAVAVTTAPGGGAIFTVTLPMAAPHGTPVDTTADDVDERVGRQMVEDLRPRRSHAASSPVASGDAPLVLVVEDNVDMSDYITQSLADRYRVAHAFEGEEGLLQAQALHPDLILSDVMMPGVSGDALVATLRGDPLLSDIPIIMLTAKADETLRIRLLELGVQDYLVKPFNVAELRARVDALMSERGRVKAYRREADVRVAAALHQLDAHMRNSPLAIVEFDTGFRVTRWSDEAERLFGWEASEMLGRAIAEVRWVHEDDIDKVRRISADMLSGGRPRNMCSNRNYRKDGTVIRCEWYNSALYDTNGDMVSILSQVLDVSERERAVEALAVARDEAERANRAKSIFLANMSHEIRTPLNVIVGLGHLLSRDLADPVQRQRLDQLCANSDHLLTLVNDVLDLSRIEAGRLVLDNIDFSLATVIERVLEVLAAPAHNKGLALAINIPPSVRGVVLRGDPLRLAQILINLGSNAVKFTERGLVRLEIAVRGEDKANVTLDFAVEDTGIGIAEADQARLFQVFTQLDDSSARVHGGSGLGLAISQRLAELMGGRILVDSQLGAGSRFSFELAVPRVIHASEPLAPRPAANMKGLRVLCAEDHPLSQEILFEMLEDLGCEVDVASDGAEALECAAMRSYDLILLDMQMPKVDGLQAARAIRRLARYHDTPIVALTANAFAEDRQQCLDAGMNGHIGKPVTPATLATALGQWLPDLAVPPAETSPCDSELCRALVAIPGLEVRDTWRRSPDQVAEYCEQLARFLAMHGEDMVQLHKHLAAGESQAAHVIAHNLKGIAGLLGVRPVASFASEIVLALRADADESAIKSLADECGLELKKLAEAVRALPLHGT